MHGIQIRQVAGGYKFSSKPHHDVWNTSSAALVRLRNHRNVAVIAYWQPPRCQIDAIRADWRRTISES
jgi:chromosome segregation and condensation protein ScpB